MPAAVDEREQHPNDLAAWEGSRARTTLPAGRIVLVPFTLVEVEQQADDDGR